MKRRIFLKSFGLACLIGLPYSLWRGIRYPRLSWESHPVADTFKNDRIELKLTDCIVSKNQVKHNPLANETQAACLRAYAPEPIIEVQKANQQTILINNISPDAKLISQEKVNESIQGITRIIELPKSGKPIVIQWQLPDIGQYEFATIGDSGGLDELGWCLTRAEQFGAKFFIHLGDFNYGPNDYESAIKQFTNAPMPCYITVGNHDFHDDGLIVGKFIDDIGPLNHVFTIKNLRYVNIDTAASFLPVSGGKRAKLVKAIVEDKHEYDDTVLFTHRSFYDPRPNEDHDFGNESEKNWFVKSLKLAKIHTILAGHIHSYFDTSSEGLRIIIAGQGIGHEDLLHHRLVSKIVVGKVTPGQAVEYRAEELAMPFELHCHAYVSKWREKNDSAFAKKINTLCEPIDSKAKI